MRAIEADLEVQQNSYRTRSFINFAAYLDDLLLKANLWRANLLKANL